MCGINFIWDKRGQLNSLGSIEAMNEVLHSRGPDGSFVHWEKNELGHFYLGHQYLQIRDLGPGSQQPFSDAYQHCFLLYNGELFVSPTFSSFIPSDTAVLFQHLHNQLLHFTPSEIENTLLALNGMYAFIWLDFSQKKILIARDPWGIKPLFFAETEDYLLISSETKGILASQLIEKEVGWGAVSAYRWQRFPTAPGTFWQQIFSVETPSVWDLSEGQVQRILTKPQREPLPARLPPRSQIVAHCHQALREALLNHLEAQVPVGLMLSGGIDSTLLLALWRASLPEAHIHTFTVVSQQAQDTDAHFARRAAQQFESVHHEIELGPEIMADLPAWWGAQDQPQADPAAFLTACLCAKASGQVKALLSGAGADETLAGYRRHWVFAQYAKFPHFWRLLACTGIPRVLRFWSKAGLIREGAGVLEKLDASLAQTFVRFTCLHWEGVSPPSFWAAPEPSDMLAFALQYDQQHYLRHNVLAITDRASMQYGIEVRVPYLDQKLQDILQNLPARIIFGRERKWILKEILKQYKGEAYLRRPKTGFGFPFGEWLRQPASEAIWRPALQTHHPLYAWLPRQTVERTLQAHLSGRADYTHSLWAWLSLFYWAEKQGRA